MQTEPTPDRRSAHLRALGGALLLSACALLAVATVVCFLLVHVSRQMGGNRDFVVYWATGRQLVEQRNPYDQSALTLVEQAAGLPHRYHVGYMRNPPWSLPLAWPLGLVSLRSAAIGASLILLAAFTASVHLLLMMYGCRDRIVRSLAFTFAPALICLIWGQTSLLVLLGLVLFFRLNSTHPFSAGASLWLCLLKPHLLLPFAVVLLVWIVVTRRYATLAGIGLTFLASVLVTFRLDSEAWTQYKQMLSYSGVTTDPIPAVSVLLRMHTAPAVMALQFAPAAVACIWAVAYFWPRRHFWDWPRDGSPILLASLLAAPYAYLNDHVVVLPALLLAAGRMSSRSLLGWLAGISALLEAAFFANWWSPAPFYWATLLVGPVWVILYWSARRASSTVAADGSFAN